MKKILPLLIVLLASCKPSTRELLTEHTWKIDKMINLKNEKLAPDGIGQGSTFEFNRNGTFMAHRITANGKWSHQGTWILDEDTLVISETENSVALALEKLTDSELIWISHSPDQIKFVLIPIHKNTVEDKK